VGCARVLALLIMSAEKTGTMIARAAGLVLIIIGASSLLNLLPWFQLPGMATGGWTSYSPTSTTTTMQLHDTYYVISSMARFYLPSAIQALCGFAMIFLSRPIGRWLAKGLRERDSDGAA